jgi:hypothetical protein
VKFRWARSGRRTCRRWDRGERDPALIEPHLVYRHTQAEGTHYMTKRGNQTISGITRGTVALWFHPAFVRTLYDSFVPAGLATLLSTTHR